MHYIMHVCINVKVLHFSCGGGRTVRHDMQAFIDNVDSSLSVGTSKRNVLYFEFSHDVYRMLFGNKESLNADDFCSRFFH